MGGFADRIRALCKDRGITVMKLETTLGLGNGYVNNTQKRGSTPSAKRLSMIADYLGVTPAFLMGEAADVPPASNGVMIPLLGRVAAGVPISAVENIIGQEEISRKLAATGELFALKIKGDSMSPFILDGDVVVVKQQNDAETGDVVIAIVNGCDGCCKKLKKTASGVTLVSLNPAYDPMVFTNEEIMKLPVTIAGKVVEIRREV